MSWLPGGTQLSGSVQVSTGWDDLVHILLNNSGFFVLVSLLPGLNSVIVGPTLFILGTTAHQIRLLPWTAQFDVLYRHTAFELVALFLAVRISYIGYFAIREFVGSGSPDKTDLVARLRGLLPLYGVMLLCTVIGAILEGNVRVHV
ncbi:MAG: hypothetical protein WAS07_01325 [Micropruina sp.]|nr:hypothetical protein [Micropruina sp.]